MIKKLFATQAIAEIILFSFFCLIVSEPQILKKPYTLKVPALLPIGGSILPVGKVCTEPIEVFLSMINNRSDILPDYNVVYDVMDEQCSDTKAIRNVFPFFMEQTRVGKVDDKFGGYQAPSNVTILVESAKTAYTAPFLVGPMCSPTCKAVSRYPHMFGLINFSAACTIGTITDRQTYPNTYRLLSDTQITDAVAHFVAFMGWNKVAIISDTVITSFITTNFTIAILSKLNVTIQAVEFYTAEPTEALRQIKEIGARIIIANTPTDSTALLFCQAYQLGLFGPNIVWIRPNSGSALTVSLPRGCTKQMVERVETGAFFYRQSPPDYLSTMTSFGMNGRDFDKFLEPRAPPEFAKASTRASCVDTVTPAVFVLDKVERLLNAKGSTLRKYIADPSKKTELMLLMRQAMSTIDMRLFAGRLRYEVGNQEILVPSIFEQSQQGNVRKPVFVDYGVEAVDKEGRFELKASIMWTTKHGEKPKVEPTFIFQWNRVAVWAEAIFSTVAVIMILASVGLIILQQYAVKQGKIQTKYPELDALAVIGAVVLLSCIVVFSGDAMETFCYVAPPLAVVGFSLLNGALLLKVTHKYDQRNSAASTKSRSVHSSIHSSLSSLRTFRSHRITFAAKHLNYVYISVWLVINISLCVLWYCFGGIPTTRQVKFQVYDEDADVLFEDSWKTCATPISSSPNQLLYLEVFACSHMALQAICLLVSIFAAVLKRQHVAAELRYTVMSIYVLFPASISVVLTVAMAATPDVIYYFLSSVVLLKCGVIVYLLLGVEALFYFGLMKRHFLSSFTGKIHAMIWHRP